MQNNWSCGQLRGGGGVCFDVAMCDLVHDVKSAHCLCEL